ncbi:MAG: hypothetical protein ACI8RD_008973 [Bacillariaceae sp.]|jgi:hypothetical protein
MQRLHYQLRQVEMIENASRLTRLLLSKRIPSVRQASRRAAAAPTIQRYASSSSAENDSTSTSTSSSDDISSDDDGTDVVVFPWRTKSSLLPRLVPGTLEHTNEGLLLTSKSQALHGNSSLNAIVTSYMFLNVPWYELFWISDIKDELSSSISWAFTHGVANLLLNLSSSSSSSGISSVSADSIISHRTNNDNSTTCGIDFHKTIEFNNNDDHDDDDDDSDENNTPTNTTSTGSNSRINTIQLQQMFQEKVVAHYKSAINNFSTKEEGNKDDPSTTTTTTTTTTNDSKQNQRLEVRLSMVPYKTEFITLYAIPYLSRNNAKSDPVLLDFYREMLDMPSTKRTSYLSQLRQEHLENKGYMESTIIAQCIVWCEELFYVKDLTTGQILQGEEQQEQDQEHSSEGKQSTDHSSGITADSKKIPHLVRMERTVITKKDPNTGSFHNVQEDWVITDIDDILGGNLII